MNDTEQFVLALAFAILLFYILDAFVDKGWNENEIS